MTRAPLRCLPFIALAAALVAPGCATAPVAASASSSASSEKPATEKLREKREAAEEAARDVRAKERSLARKKLDVRIDRMALEAAREDTGRGVEKAHQDLEIAREKLAIFEGQEMPQRRRQAEIDLRAAEHSLADAREELEQLEVMYEGSELEDRTSEIVLDRGRRQLALAEARVELRRQRNEKLELDLALELKTHARAVEDAERDLEKAERDATTDVLRKELSLREAEDAVATGEEELEAARKKAARAAAEARGAEDANRRDDEASPGGDGASS